MGSKSVACISVAAVLGVLALGYLWLWPNESDENLKLQADTSASTAEAKLEVHLERREDGGVRGTFEVMNLTDANIYLFSVLWVPTRGGQMHDPEPVYRFVVDDTLTLLSGIAPLPRFAQVGQRIVPQMTVLARGQTLRIALDLEGPLKEYGAYFNMSRTGTLQDERTSRIVAAVDYLVDRPGLQALREPGGLGLYVDPPEMMQFVTRLQTTAIPLTIDVQRRTDRFPRP